MMPARVNATFGLLCKTVYRIPFSVASPKRHVITSKENRQKTSVNNEAALA